MTRKLALILTLLLLATGGTAFGCGTSRASKSATTTAVDPILMKYEQARLALIAASVPDAQTAAKEIRTAADRAGQNAVAERSAELQDARDLATAREAFAALSDEVIKYHETRSGDQLATAYCAMEKKSWLQPIGRISNPYVDDDMRRCGEFVDDEAAPANRSSTHHH